MPPDHNELKALEQKIEENNRLLHKLNRRQNLTFIFTMIWYALLIGLPFALYYYFIGPYIEAWGFDSANLREFPGYSQFETFFGLGQDGVNVDN